MSCNCNKPSQQPVDFELFGLHPHPEFPNKDQLLVNENRLKTESYLDENVSNDTIRVAVLYIQDLIIERILGTCITNKLRALICGGEIAEKRYEAWKVLLDDYLYPIFSYGIPSEVSIPLGFKTRNNGTIQPKGDEFDQTGLEDLKYTNKWYRNRMDFYMKRAMDFILCNRCEFDICGCPNHCCPCIQSPLHRDYSSGLSLELKPKHLLRRYGSPSIHDKIWW